MKLILLLLLQSIINCIPLESKFDIGLITPTNFTENASSILLSLSQKNYFLAGDFDFYPELQYFSTSGPVAICSVCDIEGWAISELVVPLELVINAPLYISAFSLSENSDAKPVLTIESFQHCMRDCSNHGICTGQNSCDCFIGYAGYDCGLIVKEILQDQHVQYSDIYTWMFFFSIFSPSPVINLYVHTKNQIFVYISLSNSTTVLPFMNHTDFNYLQGDDFQSFYVPYDLQYSRYVIYSVFCADENCEYEIVLNQNNHDDHEKIIITVVICASVSVICLLIVVILMIRICKRLKERSACRKLALSIASRIEEFEKIHPKTAFDHLHIEENYCVICLDDIKTSEFVRLLNCKHVFHSVCIDEWNLLRNECPICKVPIEKN